MRALGRAKLVTGLSGGATVFVPNVRFTLVSAAN